MQRKVPQIKALLRKVTYFLHVSYIFIEKVQIAQDDDLFRALKTKKQSPKVQEEEEEEVDEEVPELIDAELEEAEGDELDQDEFAAEGEGMDDELENDEFADELEEDEEDGDEPNGFAPSVVGFGYGKEPAPEDEYQGVPDQGQVNYFIMTSLLT